MSSCQRRPAYLFEASHPGSVPLSVIPKSVSDGHRVLYGFLSHTFSACVAWESSVRRVRMLEESATIQMLHSRPLHDLTLDTCGTSWEKTLSFLLITCK